MKSGVSPRPRLRRRPARVGARSGFTLMELLTVIAIIALLAAILFPTIGAVRENVRKGGCSANIHAIIQAAKMYKDDWKVYPDALFGLDYGTGTGFETRLFPEYVKDAKTFNCPNSPVKLPSNPSAPTTVAPMDPMAGVTTAQYNTLMPPSPSFVLADFSSYEVHYRPNTRTPAITELHYPAGDRKWTVGAAGLGDPGGRRQLIYKNPPEDTVLTWCLYHSSMDSTGMPAKNSHALVGFLNGRVQTIPADRMVDWSGGTPYPWQVMPKN